jgi:hypothetical protein
MRQSCLSHTVREFDSHESRLCYESSALWMLGTYHALGAYWHRLSLSSHTVVTWEAMVLPSRSLRVPSTNKAQLISSGLVRLLTK